MDIGEKDKAKSHFDEYLNLYKSYNSYDSMGEFYYNEERYGEFFKIL